MRCDADCGECCTIVSATETEFREIRHYVAANGITPIDRGAGCPLYQQGACSVYPVRPVVCRLFGHSERLACSRGYNVNVPEPDVRRWALAGGRPTRILHELLPDFAAWRAGLPETINQMITQTIGERMRLNHFSIALTCGGQELVTEGYHRVEASFELDDDGAGINVSAIVWRPGAADWGPVDGYIVFSPDGPEVDRRELGYALPTAQCGTIVFGAGECAIATKKDVAPPRPSFLSGIAEISGTSEGKGTWWG